MSMFSALSSAFTRTMGAVEEIAQLTETSVRTVRIAAEGCEQYSIGFKADATLDAQKTLHRVNIQQKEFEKQLAALEV